MKLSVRSARVAAGVALSGGLAMAGLLSGVGTTATADPANAPGAQPLVGVGSNTIQDLMDAYSGAAPTPHNVASQATKYYTPLADPTTGTQILSYSAAAPNDLSTGGCISTKSGGNSFARPNGSGDGLKALSDEIASPAQVWSKAQAGSCAGVNIAASQIDFVRSSSGPSGATGTTLTWIDFAHDALTYAYVPENGMTAAQATTLTSGTGSLKESQLDAVFNDVMGTNALTVPDTASPTGYDLIMPAFIQDGSGTDKTWLTDLGDVANLNSGSTFTTQSNLEENSADALVNGLPAAVTSFVTNDANVNICAACGPANTKIAANTPVLVVEGFSAGAWISEGNKVALDRSATGRTAGVNLGSINFDVHVGGAAQEVPAFTGTAGSFAPNIPYYQGPFGRDLFLIVPWQYLNGSVSQRVPAARAIFGFGPTGGTTNQLCSSANQATLTAFGFIPLSQDGGTITCGTESNTVGTTGQGS